MTERLGPPRAETTSSQASQLSPLDASGVAGQVRTHSDIDRLPALRLALAVNTSNADWASLVTLAQTADSLGFHSIWVNESYGSDSVVPLTWLGAHTGRIKLGAGIMQIPARTPAMTAMTAMTLDRASGGRFILGLGVSGPQVAEGWHGQSYRKPLGRTREYVSIVRQILAREEPLEYHGEHYEIPYAGHDATGLGKPLKSILSGSPGLPIYLAALGPKNVRLASEIADGWLPALFSPEKSADVFCHSLEGCDPTRFDVAPSVRVVFGNDLSACYDAVKPWIALYVGGMGAAGKNFYNDLVCRFGYEEAAGRIQTHYLAGRKKEAVAAVPNQLVDEIALVGSRARVADRLGLWSASSATTLVLATQDITALRNMAELIP